MHCECVNASSTFEFFLYFFRTGSTTNSLTIRERFIVCQYFCSQCILRELTFIVRVVCFFSITIRNLINTDEDSITIILVKFKTNLRMYIKVVSISIVGIISGRNALANYSSLLIVAI